MIGPIASLFLTAMATVAIAAPASIAKRALCEQNSLIVEGAYIVYNNLWGESSASAGSQCIEVQSFNETELAWSTSWSWSGDSDGVKSYANAKVTYGQTTLSDITSLPSTFHWKYEGDNLVGDVSYDMFTSSTANGDNEYEIMIWLDKLGDAEPINSVYGSDGEPTPVATTDISGSSFNLYKGPNGDTTVFSFVANTAVKDFSGDIKDFFAYLIDNEGLSDSQYLLSIGAGTEAFTGSDAQFTVSSYSLSMDS